MRRLCLPQRHSPVADDSQVAARERRAALGADAARGWERKGRPGVRDISAHCGTHCKLRAVNNSRRWLLLLSSLLLLPL